MKELGHATVKLRREGFAVEALAKFFTAFRFVGCILLR